MVSVVENWARIEGVVRETRSDSELPDHVVATVDVRSVEPVPDPAGGEFPNLFGDAVGGNIDLHVPVRLAAVAGLAAGRTISAVAKRATPTRSFVRELTVT
jgi:hypothetical protein